MANEVQVSQSKAPAELIAAAMAAGTDLDKLEKLLSLQERWEAGQARKEYAEAFAVVQEKITPVLKKKLNPQTHSNYAELSDILAVVKPVYSAAGFSMIFYEGDTDKPEHIRVFCDVLHRAGHKETYHFDVPIDCAGIKGNVMMTKTHGKSSAAAYGRRYLTCMILNVPTADNDGNVKKPEVMPSEEELIKLNDWLVSTGTDQKAMLDHFKIESMKDMTKAIYDKAIVILKAKESQKKKQDGKK